MIKLYRHPLRTDSILPALMAISITLFLFYIDEGKYNFDGILRPDNLLFLVVYGAVFFGFQLLVKMGLEYLIGSGILQSIISGVLSALILLLILAFFFWMVRPN